MRNYQFSLLVVGVFAIVFAPKISYPQVLGKQIKVLNKYDDPLSVSIGTSTSVNTVWKLIYPKNSAFARFNYKLTNSNLSYTFIHYRYDLESLGNFLFRKEEKLFLLSKADYILKLMAIINNCPDKNPKMKLVCILENLVDERQKQAFLEADSLYDEYYKLFNLTKDKEKKECLDQAMSFVRKAIFNYGLPSIALEIQPYVSNVLGDYNFSVPISEQIYTTRQLNSQFEIGSYYSSDYSFKNVKTDEKEASFLTRVPFVIKFNKFIGSSKTLWPKTYLSAGYLQSPLMYSNVSDSLFQKNKAVSYSHASFGVGYLTNSSHKSELYLTCDLEVSYRLNFRKEHQINVVGNAPSKIKINSSESKGLESGNFCFGLGLGLVYKKYILKGKISYATGASLFEKEYRYPIDGIAFGILTLAIPLTSKNVILYHRATLNNK